MTARERHNVVEHGPSAGRPMVVAHGLGCDQSMWRHVWPAFAEDHRVVLFDQVRQPRRSLAGDHAQPRPPVRRGLIAPESVGEYVARELPERRLVHLEATGHCPNLSAPQETVAAIKAFLAS